MRRGQSFTFQNRCVTLIEEDYFRLAEKLRATNNAAAREAREHLESLRAVTSEMSVHAADALYKAVLDVLEEMNGSRQLRRLKKALEVEYHMVSNEQGSLITAS